MKTNKLGFLGLFTIIAFNYALMEKTPLQIIKLDTSRNIAAVSETVSSVSVPSTIETAQALNVREVTLDTIIKSESDIAAATTSCNDYIKTVATFKGTKLPLNKCSFLSEHCGTSTTHQYTIDLNKADRYSESGVAYTGTELENQINKSITEQLTAEYKNLTTCTKKEEVAKKTEDKKEELLPASKTDAVETASNGQIPNQTTGKASSEVATSSAIVLDPDLVEYDSIKEECAAIHKGVKSDRRRRTSRRSNSKSAAAAYANRRQRTEERVAVTPEYDITDDLLEDAEEILKDELTSKSEMKYCLKKFKRSRNNALRTLARDFETVQKHEERVAEEVANNLSRYDFASAQITQQQNGCLANAQYLLPRGSFLNAQTSPVYARNQQTIQQVNQGAQQAYDQQVRYCQTQFNTNTLRSQYSNGLNNYLQGSTNYLQGRVQTSSAVSSYQSWVRNEISAVQNALGYNTGFTTPSFIPGNTQRTFSPSSTTNIQQSVVAPSVANPQFANNTLPGTSTLSSFQVTGNYNQVVPQVATPNFNQQASASFAPATAQNGQLPGVRSPLRRN